MASAWGFDRLKHGSKSRPSPGYINQSVHHRKPFQSHIHPYGATIHRAKLVYPPHHLLGLPIEVRYILWNVIASAIMETSSISSCQGLGDDFKGLLISCRQTFWELEQFWYMFTIPWSRVRKFLEVRLNRTTVQKYRSLSIELSLNGHPGYFTGLAAVLHKVQPYLKELRIYFTGTDQYGRRVFSNGCGSLATEALHPKLPIDGQLRTELLPLWKRIAALSRLEVLVISNPNLQVFESMLLTNKPRLEFLYLPTDARSTVHTRYHANDLGFLLTAIPPKDQYPPVRVLHVATNALLATSALAAKVAETLEHLTWVMPDSAMQSGEHNLKWHEQTGELLIALRLRGVVLQTLRICITGAGLYEDQHSGLVIGSLKLHLPYLASLKHFEIHVKSKSYWLGKEIIARLPDQLEHFYITDRTVHVTDLLHQVWERYLAAADVDSPNKSIQDVSCLQANNQQQRHHKQRQPVDGACQLPWYEDEGPWYISRHDSVYTHDKELSTICIHRLKSSSERLIQPGYFDNFDFISSYRAISPRAQIIGELPGRYDYIPFHTGQLRFVHYEYDLDRINADNEASPPALLTTLLVNGRLLDRARNQHLACYDPGQFIPPTLAPSMIGHEHESDTATKATSLHYAILLHTIYEIEATHPRSSGQILAELENCPALKRANPYFGLEDQAAQVFGKERAAKVEELPPYRFPVEKVVGTDGKCHWMSPDAVIPGMTERGKARGACS